MKRRGRASGQLVKGRARGAIGSKLRKAPPAPVSATDLHEQVAALTRELQEAREQQTATLEVLRVISVLPGELDSVFKEMLEKATQICEASFGTLLLFDGNAFRRIAAHNAPHEYVQFADREPFIRLDRAHTLDRLTKTKEPVQIADMAEAEPNSPLTTLGGARTYFAVPMLKENKLIGVIGIYRQEVRPFTDKQIELVQNFATQAVIAIENTRLLNELRQRTDDLSESLEQQSATSEVLKAISSSPGELEPVFQAVLEKAVRVCGAKFGILFLSDGDGFRTTAMHNVPRAFAKKRERRAFVRPPPASPLGRAKRTKQVAHVADITAERGFAQSDALRDLAELGGARTAICVPMLNDNEVIGAITIYNKEVRPFTDKQIELLTNFASQAVIAIENTRLLNDLRESLQQQTATSEVLKVISSSPGDLTPVFESILVNATRICEAKFANLVLVDGNELRVGATHGAPAAFADLVKPGSAIPRTTPVGRVIDTKRPFHIADVKADETYRNTRLAKQAGARTTLGVPMLKDNQIIGAILIYRQEVRLFTDKQIELVSNFAAQAVIAIENTRLLNEQRESLERQTAISEVLQVISSSRGEIGPVFKIILASATRICEAGFGLLHLNEGDAFRTVELHNVPQELADFVRRRGSFTAPDGSPLNRILKARDVIYTADESAEANPGVAARLGGARSLIAVPMNREGKLIGAIVIYRQEVRPFTDKQIALLRNFASQAVIAIDNARLLNELRQRTDDLTKSLEQQTATSEVLQVISSSPGALEPVFESMLANAVRLCEASHGVLLRYEEGAFRQAAMLNVPQAHADSLRKRGRFLPEPGIPLDRVWRTKELVHTIDEAASPNPAPAARLAGARSHIVVPMLKDNELVGAIIIYRQEVRPFTEKQIELVKNFAAQAVIAIENARLLNELRESLEQQTATSEVLEVISSSPGELAPVFEAILGNATRICEAKFGTLTQIVDGIPRLVFQLGVPAPLEEYWRRETPRPSSNNAISRVITTGQAVHVSDLQAYQAYIDGDPLAVAGVELGGIRTLLVVPMLKDGKTFGTIGIYRQEVHPFTNKQIELVSNFAAQAAIAIENTRLLNELRQRTDDLSQSLEDLRSAQDRLVQTEKLASLGQLTAGIAHEIKNPLNFVNNFSGISAELIEELQETLRRVKVDDKTRTEITELADTLRGNLEKVVQHGMRADAIVKNMLLHSRQGSQEHRPVDINAIVEESLNLAYHGARAEKQGFNITLERSLDPTVGEVDVFPQEITRVLLNLISNGFYAATKRKAETDGGSYEPTLAAATRNLGDSVEIRIRDNGTGIPPDVKERMFNPFFTTKPVGEGTGLGLSISHDIIVKQHGGSIEVETQPGEFTEFRIVLPRGAASIAKLGGSP